MSATTFSEAISDVLIFRTNIVATDIEVISNPLNAEVRIKKWNIDCEDVDHVLRVEAAHIEMQEIINLIQKAGFACEELPD